MAAAHTSRRGTVINILKYFIMSVRDQRFHNIILRFDRVALVRRDFDSVIIIKPHDVFIKLRFFRIREKKKKF